MIEPGKPRPHRETELHCDRCNGSDTYLIGQGSLDAMPGSPNVVLWCVDCDGLPEWAELTPGN